MNDDERYESASPPRRRELGETDLIFQEAADWSRVVWLLAGIGIGAGGYALLDRRRGAERRAMIRDKALAASRELSEGARRRGRDLAHRAKGAAHEARARMTEDEVPDEVLVERVRAQIGRPVSHPRALEVLVENGRVTLYGPILASEVEGLLSTVRKVRGVREIRNQLEVHASGGHIPALQGEGRRPSE